MNKMHNFSFGDTDLFSPLVDELLYHDEYMLCADFEDYVRCHERVSVAYQDTERWTTMSILNTARSGYFSSDRTIDEYNREIWKATKLRINSK